MSEPMRLGQPDPVGARRYATRKRPRARIVLAHGAGAPQSHPFMVEIAQGLAARDVEAITFDFPYADRGRRAPDRAEALEACFARVLADVRARGLPKAPLFIGGKSMGGRIASQLAAKEDLGVAGLVFLGYPLHPPGKPQQLRVKHLPRVRAPMLFVQGTRDPFGGPDEIGQHAGKNAIVAVEGGDHSFAVPKKLGVTHEEVMARVLDAVVAWMTRKDRPR